MEEIAATSHKSPKEWAFFESTLKARIQSVSFLESFKSLTPSVHVR